MRTVDDAETGTKELLVLSIRPIELMVWRLFHHFAFGTEDLNTICPVRYCGKFWSYSCKCWRYGVWVSSGSLLLRAVQGMDEPRISRDMEMKIMK